MSKIPIVRISRLKKAFLGKLLFFFFFFSTYRQLLVGKTQVSYDDWFSYWMERISTDIEDIKQPMESAAEKTGAMEDKEGENSLNWRYLQN